MRRRALLASALTAASTVTAGCSSVQPRTEYTDPTVNTSDEPQDDEKYLEFHHDGTEIATLGADPNFDPLPNDFFTWISHTEDTELQSLTQRFVASNSDGTPPQLSPQTSSEGDNIPHPSVSLSQDGMAAVMKVDQFGKFADETVFIPLTVTRWPESARRLVVENTVELVERGLPDRTYVLDGQLEFEFTAETEASE